MPRGAQHETARITDIRRCGPALRRRSIVIDGDPWRDVPGRVASFLALSVGDEVDRDELAAQIEEAERPLARERALRLLTARERSRAGLLVRLVEDGFGQDVAQDTVSDFVRIGLVDDERFANALARTLANARGVGRSGIARELRGAGVAEDLAAAALDEALGDEVEEAAASRLAASAASRPGATVDKVAARLVRRGYRLSLALSAAREALDSAGAGARDISDEDGPAPLDD